MAWTATATVQDVSDNSNPPVDILLVAEGTNIINTDDDSVINLEIKLVSSTPTHLVVGNTIQIVANC